MSFMFFYLLCLLSVFYKLGLDRIAISQCKGEAGKDDPNLLVGIITPNIVGSWRNDGPKTMIFQTEVLPS